MKNLIIISLLLFALTGCAAKQHTKSDFLNADTTKIESFTENENYQAVYKKISQELNDCCSGGYNAFSSELYPELKTGEVNIKRDVRDMFGFFPSFYLCTVHVTEQNDNSIIKVYYNSQFDPDQSFVEKVKTAIDN